MRQLAIELDRSFEQFTTHWQQDRTDAFDQLDAHREIFRLSYRRIASLQAWRAYIVEPMMSSESIAFFLEAQNDALASHINARVGAWRSALQALRSCIENVLCSLYYKDHPVEARMWQIGTHRLAFSALLSYAQNHPDINGLPASITGLADIASEYSTLSRAVHASASGFRMTQDGSVVQLFAANKPNLGRWSSRERLAIASVNLILLAFYREELDCTKQRDLRKAVSFSIHNDKKAQIRAELGVRLYTY